MMMRMILKRKGCPPLTLRMSRGYGMTINMWIGKSIYVEDKHFSDLTSRVSPDRLPID